MHTLANPAAIPATADIINNPDGYALDSVASEYGRAIPVYDDAFGPLWLLCDSMGIMGVIRAQTFEDAYGIAEDEMFPEADCTLEEMAKECGHQGAPETLWDNAIWQENYGFRPNGPRKRDVRNHGIYQRDLNGESLNELNAAGVAMHSLTVYVVKEAE